MSEDLWELAGARRRDQVFSTLFPARSVEEQINSEAGISEAVDWCRKTGVTKVYLESFRDGLLAREENLARARDGFREAGLEVSGCVTTTNLVTPPDFRDEWSYFPCFTYPAAEEQTARVFSFTARLFDEIMIDDFYCTYCECALCREARGERDWSDYRRDLMVQVSRDFVLEPARRSNPDVKVIIKYPQWYEDFHSRGYDVDRETELFDRIWVGTEARDMTDSRWGGCATYRPFWIMRWLGRIGGARCGGGWYDPYGTHEDTYLEQARQTILGGARESLLFCYPSLLRDTGPANVDALRRELPSLFDLAAWVKGEAPRGLTSYRPVNAPPGDERYVFDWLGMIGLPVTPDHEFPGDSQVALFSAHALHDPEFADRAAAFLKADGCGLFTAAAARAAGISSGRRGAAVFDPPADARELLELPENEVSRLREAALAPHGMAIEGPTGVSLYLLGERKIALESFLQDPAQMRLRLPDAGSYETTFALGREGVTVEREGERLALHLPPRTLVALERKA